MFRSVFAIAFISLIATPALAEDHSAHAMPGMAAPAAGTLSEGIVKKIDSTKGKLTLTHGPLKNLGMEGMTMSFAVSNPAWLSQFKVGDKVRFLAEEPKGVLTVTRIELAK